jgi:large subunit ribosomal protein L22
MAASTKTASAKSKSATPEVPGVETRATVRHLSVSPNKIRPVLDLVRRMSAEDSERVLQLQPRTAAGHVLKLLESAIANAEHNQQIPIDELFIDRCWCDEGPTRKWGQARARGRYFRVRKRSSHVTIILARYTDDELRKKRGREETTGTGGAGGRLARRRADRVRASRAAARGETIEEHDHDHDHEGHDHEGHDHEGHDHEGHDHEHDEEVVSEVEATEPEASVDAGETTEVEESEVAETGAEAPTSDDDTESGNEASE